MKQIDRYIIRNHIGPFLFGFTIVMFLNLMQFLLNNLDKLVGKGLSFWVIMQLLLTNLAWMAILAVPMGILLSTLMAFGGMSASNEIMVFKTSGASLIRMMASMIIIGAIFSYALYWFNDQILPDANHSAKTLMLDIQRKKPTFILESGNFSNDMEGYTILTRSVDSISGKLFGVTIYDNRRSTESSITSADTGVIAFTSDYSKLILTLYNGENNYLIPGTGINERKSLFKKYQFAMRADGFAFTRSNESAVSRSDREMKIADMQKIVNEAELKYKDALKKINMELDNHWNYLSVGVQFDKSKANEIKSPNPEIRPNNSLSVIKTPPIQTGLLKINKIKKPKIHKKEKVKVQLANKTNGLQADKSKTIPIIASKPDSSKNSNIHLPRYVAEQAAQQRIQYLRSTLQSEIFQMNESRQRADSYIVEIQKKYSIPFACFVFVFVGAPLGIITRGGNFGWSAGISIGFYILYWACLIGGEKLSDREYMSPVLSMWLGNIIVGILGLILTLKVNNESFGIPFKKIIKFIFQAKVKTNKELGINETNIL